MPSNPPHVAGTTSGIPSTPAVFRESRGAFSAPAIGRFAVGGLHVNVVVFVGHRRDETRGLIMIRKLKSGQYRLYSRKVDPKTGRRRNLGTFSSRAAAERHERAVQFFKRHG